MKALLFACMFLFATCSILFCQESKGKTLYTSCAACHGANAEGNANFKAPSLVGAEKWYFIAQINKFKTGARGSHPDDINGKLMAPMAAMLSNETEIVAVFDYIQTIKKEHELKSTLGGNAEKGKALYATCVACHGDKAQGNEALKAPALNKQEDWYILEQLIKFKKDIRGADAKDTEGKMMAPMAKMLTNEEAMKDVIAYILTLK